MGDVISPSVLYRPKMRRGIAEILKVRIVLRTLWFILDGLQFLISAIKDVLHICLFRWHP